MRRRTQKEKGLGALKDLPLRMKSSSPVGNQELNEDSNNQGKATKASTSRMGSATSTKMERKRLTSKNSILMGRTFM